MPIYTKTTWVNGAAPAVSATNLNKIEEGINLATPRTGRAIASTSSWSATASNGFSFTKNVPITGITEAMNVSVLFLGSSLQDAITANASFAETYNGGIRLYADSVPTSALTFDFVCNQSFSPYLINGLQLWLDASDPTTITQSGNSVSEWRDKSGFNRHATQATSSHQPIYNATGFYNYPSIGWNSAAACSMNISIPITTEYHIFAIFTQNLGGASYQRIINGVNGAATNNQLFFGTWGQMTLTTPLWSSPPPSNSPFYYNTTIQPIMQSMACGTSAGIQVVVPHINGFSQNTRLDNRGNLTGLQLFSLNGATEIFQGQIAEIVIFNRVLQETERTMLEGYFIWKYGVFFNTIPAAHPYLNFSP